MAVACSLPCAAQEAIDTLALPPLTARGTIAHYPCYGDFLTGFSDWQLHSGLNASLSAAVLYNKHLGAGFANSLSLMGAGQLKPRLSYAIGGYHTLLDWGPNTVRTAGLTAMLGYQLDEHWQAAVFAQKVLAHPQFVTQPSILDGLGDRLGVAVRYSPTPAFSIGLSVWSERHPYPVDNPVVPSPLRHR